MHLVSPINEMYWISGDDDKFALISTGQMTQLCELINKSGELLAKNLSHLDTVLGALDIQEHSLGVLAVL